MKLVAGCAMAESMSTTTSQDECQCATRSSRWSIGLLHQAVVCFSMLGVRTEKAETRSGKLP